MSHRFPPGGNDNSSFTRNCDTGGGDGGPLPTQVQLAALVGVVGVGLLLTCLEASPGKTSPPTPPADAARRYRRRSHALRCPRMVACAPRIAAWFGLTFVELVATLV
jgi:hypothetical protein